MNGTPLPAVRAVGFVHSGLITTEFVPFGGVKESGNGRDGSRHGIDDFVEKKYRLIAGLI